MTNEQLINYISGMIHGIKIADESILTSNVVGLLEDIKSNIDVMQPITLPPAVSPYDTIPCSPTVPFNPTIPYGPIITCTHLDHMKFGPDSNIMRNVDSLLPKSNQPIEEQIK